jgi:hypothetical protein
MRASELRDVHLGDQVRIISCPEKTPEHQGQIGILINHPGKAMFRVQVGMGICRAIDVEKLEDGSNKNEPKFVRGQSVRIIECNQGYISHNNRIGQFIVENKSKKVYSIRINSRICYAAKIEAVETTG